MKSTQAADLAKPAAYKGLYAFHKYWGKKPAEPIRFLIEQLSQPGALVVDPFLGSGISAVEAGKLKRRFIGIDINPAATRLARLLIAPPLAKDLRSAADKVRTLVRSAIMEAYLLNDGGRASHYVWQGSELKSVWVGDTGKRQRIEREPCTHDIELAKKLESYEPKILRQPRFFANSRINSTDSLTLKDIFTGRALRNIELLLEAIDKQGQEVREALKLCLTASVGQMSRMVFAITGRGKVKGKPTDKLEVGSWVIGYWRPELHFEVNVWDTYERRVEKLCSAIEDAADTLATVKSGSVVEVSNSTADLAIIQGNCLRVLKELPDDSVELVVTDPPHGDRIPYLELSELWNTVLDERPPFEDEIVISNAKKRLKTSQTYHDAMGEFLHAATTKLSKSGSLVLFFNTRSKESWDFLNHFAHSAEGAGLNYRGCFPLVYSAGSVVQDNRQGALKTDYALVYSRSRKGATRVEEVPNWSSEFPQAI